MQPDKLSEESEKNEDRSDPRSRQCPYLDTINR